MFESSKKDKNAASAGKGTNRKQPNFTGGCGGQSARTTKNTQREPERLLSSATQKNAKKMGKEKLSKESLLERPEEKENTDATEIKNVDDPRPKHVRNVLL